MSLLSVTAAPDDRRRPRAADVFARAARMALAGLLVPPAAAAVASLVGAPVRGGVRDVFDWLPVLAFTASGILCAPAVGASTRIRLLLAAGTTIAGLAVVPAYGSLQGLTGREPAGVVAGVVVGAFGGGFLAAAGAAAMAMDLPRGRAFRVAGLGGLAGLVGGVVALVPFGWAVAGRPGGVGGYLGTLLAVGSALGCLIAPYRLVGLALDEAAGRDVST